MRKWISLVLPLVGLVIFVWIVRGTGLDRVLDTFRRIDPKRLAVFPIFTVFILWIRGYRWWILLRLVGIPYTKRRSSMVWAIGFFAASITPGKVGDAVRALYVSRETGRGLGESFLTVFMDRLMDLVVVLVFGVATILLFSYRYTDMPSIWVIVAASVAALGLVYLVLNRSLMRALAGPFFRALTPKKYRAQLSTQVHGFYDALSLYAGRWRSTAFAFFLTLVFWAGIVLLAYTATRILEIDVSFGYVALMMPMVTLVEIVPISISGIGTREAAVIFFFAAVGIGSAQAVAFSIMYLMAGTYLTALVGFLAWLANPAKLNE
jgi:glycosyltransferase 2 family protein